MTIPTAKEAFELSSKYNTLENAISRAINSGRYTIDIFGTLPESEKSLLESLGYKIEEKKISLNEVYIYTVISWNQGEK